MKILSYVDSPLAQKRELSCTLVNTLLKAQVNHTSDRGTIVWLSSTEGETSIAIYKLCLY